MENLSGLILYSFFFFVLKLITQYTLVICNILGNFASCPKLKKLVSKAKGDF